MSPSQRMRAWGVGVSAGHLLLGTVGFVLLGVPPYFFAGCAIVTFGGALLAAPLLAPRGEDGGDDGGGGRGQPCPTRCRQLLARRPVPPAGRHR
jgi:hypothetical protein